MADRGELLISAVLAALCLLAAAFAIVPRMAVRSVPISIEAPEISVAVGGAVARPGVYRLPLRSRVIDVVELAGGFTAEAETSLVDLAAAVGPGDRVQVPSRYDDSGEERISLNSAPAPALESLPGVGPVTAARIVAGRPYSRLEELLRVKGIGERTLERLRPHLRL